MNHKLIHEGISDGFIIEYTGLMEDIFFMAKNMNQAYPDSTFTLIEDNNHGFQISKSTNSTNTDVRCFA